MAGIGLLSFRCRQIFLARAATDMRKSFDSLAAIVRSQVMMSPQSGDAFVFFNRLRTRVKVLLYDGGGFWVLAKRPDQGRFPLPIDLADADGVGCLKVAASTWQALVGLAAAEETHALPAEE